MLRALLFAVLVSKAPAVPMVVVWKNVEPSPGCFFFSGPGDLGRDVTLGERAKLTEEGKWLTLAFDDKTRFRGRVDGKNEVRLERQSAHEFGGTWQVIETIEGTWVDGLLTGEYTYGECDTTHKEGCPGRCIIRARIDVMPPELQMKPTDRAIADAVRRCVETGLQFNPAFRRGGTVTVRWRANEQHQLTEVGFWENVFADLWVNSVQSFNDCVEEQMRAAEVDWRGTGSFTVKVAPPP